MRAPILGVLDPIAGAIEGGGWELARGAIEHRYLVGVLLTAAIAAFAFVAHSPGRRIGWAAAALLAGTWGQVLLFSDIVVPGIVLYLGALAAAVVFGAGTPLGERRGPVPLWADGAALASLTGLALIVRVYALDELPTFVDIEPALAFFESLSPYGLAHYVVHNRVDDDGFAHMLARAAVQQVTGPSVLGIRLAGVLFNTLAVPLCYTLVRRLTAGVLPAALAALLLLSAPDQLIFARIEATQIAAVSAAALITAHVVLWLVRGWSPAAALAAALWMPFSRYFYAPAIVLFLLPLATAAHGLCFSAARRRAAIALAILLGGAALWLGASPALRFAATGSWGGASSLRIYGISFYEPFGVAESAPEFRGAAMLRFQAERFLTHSGDLVKQLAYDRGGYSTFYLRDHPDEQHKRAIHAAVLVPFVAGLGYLLANWRDPRAALLVFWVLLGVLPALMSDEVEPRRLSVFYPAVTVIVGVFVDAVMRALPAGAPRRAAWPLRAALAVAAGFIIVTSLAVHLRVPRDTLQYTEYVDFARPYFETSDVIFHNVQDVNTIGILAFGNAEPFRRRLPGFHFVGDWDAEWSRVTETIGCPFDHELFKTVASETTLAARCAGFRPARVTYLLRVDTPEEQAVARRLREHFPAAAVHQMSGRPQDDPIRNLFALTVDR